MMIALRFDHEKHLGTVVILVAKLLKTVENRHISWKQKVRLKIVKISLLAI